MTAGIFVKIPGSTDRKGLITGCIREVLIREPAAIMGDADSTSLDD